MEYSDEGPLDRIFKRIERAMREMEEAIAREVERAIRELRPEEREVRFFAESIEPLYAVRDLGDRVVVYVDLPYADTEKVNLWFEENVMYVKAKLKSRIDVGKWSERYRGIEVEEYSLSITPPVKPKPEKTRIRVKKGVLKVVVYE